MGADGSYARMCEFADICAAFAVICHSILYDWIVNSSLDVGDDKDLVAFSLVFLRGPYAREINITVSCRLWLNEAQYLHRA